jgi:hypothetical protein
MAAHAPHPAIIPPPLPRYSVKNGRFGSSIQIEVWTIEATKRPILNGKEIDS